MLKKSIEKMSSFIELIYVLFVSSYFIVLSISGMGGTYSKLRYFILTIAIVISGICLFLKKSSIKYKNMLLVIPLGIIFYLISLFRAGEAHHALVFRTYVQISLIVLPALYAMLLLNLLNLKQITTILEFTLCFAILAYFFESGHQIKDFLILENWKTISFLHSNSFTESNLCSEIFLNLFLFFNFYKNNNFSGSNPKYLKLCYYLSFIFTILSFKRLAVIFAILIMIISYFINLNCSIPKKYSCLFSIAFTLLTILYTEFMKGNLFSWIDVYTFTSGRDYILSLWKQLDYLSFGYGSSMVLIGRYLEMDLVQIYLELNLFAVFLFSWVYFRIAGNNLYSLIIMVYCFFNMLTASSLPGSLSWIIVFLTVKSISSRISNEHIDFDIN